jgi:hypothetical protein
VARGQAPIVPAPAKDASPLALFPCRRKKKPVREGEERKKEKEKKKRRD